jgi:bacterioferritin-associated ferredoxin
MGKVCRGCGELLPLSEFGSDASRVNGLKSRCRSCMRAYEVILKSKRNQVNYAYVRNLKENFPCTDCGQKYPYYVMDFDHIGTDKSNNVSEMVNRFGLATIIKEIAKCELICSNCHRIRTHKRRQSTGV